MKKIVYTLLSAMMLVGLASCDKHDKLDDLVYVGKMAPQVQWTVTSTTVNAGANIPFTARYYTTSDVALDHLEVWYNIREVETKNVSAPFVSSFSYTLASEQTVERRISQSISKYAHNEDWWNAQERSYNFNSTFPTSNTLSKISWGATDWDSTLVSTYYGEAFMQQFKDSLYHILFVEKKPDEVYNDLRTLYSQLGGSSKDYIMLFTDSTFNPNTTLYDRHFKNHEMPQALDSLYKATGFADLIYSSTGASISYSKQYFLTAQLKCYDKEGTAGLSLTSDITLN